jgi:hypothetical protein
MRTAPAPIVTYTDSPISRHGTENALPSTSTAQATPTRRDNSRAVTKDA